MKTSEITAGKVYGDGLGRFRWVKEIYGITEVMVDYKKVWRGSKDGLWQVLNHMDGTCKLVTFASWAKEEIE